MSADIYREILTDDKVFSQTLARIRSQGHRGLTDTELQAIIAAAVIRGRLDELDEAAIQGKEVESLGR